MTRYGNITTDDDVDMDDTWRCVHCNARNHPDGPPQCGWGTMRPGYECCAWCQEHYGPISTFQWDGNDPICPTCVAWKRTERRKMRYGIAVLIAILIVGAVMMGLMEISS